LLDDFGQHGGLLHTFFATFAGVEPFPLCGSSLSSAVERPHYIPRLHG
jgi:hypothetical protein